MSRQAGAEIGYAAGIIMAAKNEKYRHITPQMIGAGADVLSAWRAGGAGRNSDESNLVALIYSAMAAAAPSESR